MGFKNSAQRRACYYQQTLAKKAGRQPTWDCKKFAKVKVAGRLRKVHKSKRGAKYVNVKGKKVYLSTLGITTY